MAERVKLNALLPAELDSVGERARLKLCENQDIGGMKLAWGYIGGELQKALAQALDCDLMEMLARGWAQADLLAEFADSARHPAGERSIVEIGAHDYSRELKPVIAVTLANSSKLPSGRSGHMDDSALVDRNERVVFRTRVVGRRADDLAIDALLDDVRRPAGRACDNK